MEKIKLIACDVDGVLVEDTFSPILYQLANKIGIEYTARLERNMFSRPRNESLQFIAKELQVTKKEEMDQLYELYFTERNKYIEKNGFKILDGVEDFLNLISKFKNIKLVCYGGLEYEHLHPNFRDNILPKFEKYICTNNFRPGIKEITTELYDFNYDEVLFIDDVNTVAEVAKNLDVAFIGVPSKETWSHQKSDMEKTGVKNIVLSINDISESLLNKIDKDNINKNAWK